MRVGINYPWKNYGWDFGPTPIGDGGAPWGPRAAWKQTIDADLAEFTRLGCFAIRWFILGDGIMLGTGDACPRPDPHRPGDWRFASPPPLASELLADFEYLLQRFRAAGLLFLPVLLDFDLCREGERAAGTSRYVKQGRADLFRDPSTRDAFFDRILTPLLDLSAGYRDVIYAWELMNEPEWCTGDGRAVPLSAMLEFLRLGVGRINAAGFQSTVGFGAYDTLTDWSSPALGITLHQYHYYGEPKVLPTQNYDPSWPLILGEFASAPHNHWPELGATQDVHSRLSLIEQRNYPATFLWASSRAHDPEVPPAVDWSSATQSSLAQYTGRATAKTVTG